MEEGWSDVVADVIKTPFIVLYHVCRSAIAWVLPKQYKSITDDVVLITGGGRGIGKRLALEFCKFQPKHIILWGRHGDSLLSASKEVISRGVPCTFMVCDVNQREKIYQQAKRVKETIGPVTILVNNAGIVYGNTILESRDDEIEQTLQVNTLAHFWTLKAFLPDMVGANRGHIVAVDSMLGMMALNGASIYSTSKYATSGLVESLLAELKEEVNVPDVRLTIVYPYQVDNAMFAGCTSRFPHIFPPLQEQYVAEKTLDAILTNQRQVIMPRMMYFLIWMKSWLPVPALIAMFKFLGVNKAMDTFEGRSRDNPAKENGIQTDQLWQSTGGFNDICSNYGSENSQKK